MSDAAKEHKFSEMEQAAIEWKARQLFAQEQAKEREAFAEAVRQTGVSEGAAVMYTVVAHADTSNTQLTMLEKSFEAHKKKVTEQAAKDPKYLREIVKEAAEDEYKRLTKGGIEGFMARAFGRKDFTEKEATPDGVDNKFDHGLSFKEGTGADENRLLKESPRR